MPQSVSSVRCCCGNEWRLNRPPLSFICASFAYSSYTPTVNSQRYQQNTPLTTINLNLSIKYLSPAHIRSSIKEWVFFSLQLRSPSPPKGSSSVLSLFRSRSISIIPPSPCWWKSAAIWSKVLPRVSGTRKNVKMRKNRSNAAKIRNTYGPQRF